MINWMGWAVCLKWEQTHTELFHSGAGSSGTAVPTQFLRQGHINVLWVSAKAENKVSFFRWDYITRNEEKGAWKRGKLGSRSKGHVSLSSSVPFHLSRGPVCRVWVWKARGKRDAGSGRWDYKSAVHICVLVYARGWSKRTVCASERRQWLAQRFLAFIFVCVRGCEWSKHVRREGFW